MSAALPATQGPFVVTHGCKANQADGAWLEGALAGREVVVVNTCTVTQAADADARQAIRAASRERPGVPILVTGCSATIAPEAYRDMPEVRWVVPNPLKTTIPQLLEAKAPADRVDFMLGPGQQSSPARFTSALSRSGEFRLGTRPFVKVQDGCDYVCSFCVIPAARGPARSRPLDEVVTEVRALERAGAREVVLTGIHLGHWGRDHTPRRTLAELVDQLLEATSVARIRLGSVEPNEVDAHLVRLVSAHPRVCRHLHVPLQSGDDRVLALMRRVYRVAAYRRVVEAVKARAPGVAVSADVLVGFPGEDTAAFERTRALVEDLGLAYLHVFPYSQRPGTAALRLPGGVPKGELRVRAEQMRATADSLRARFEASSVGTYATVLVERRRQQGLLFGRSERYIGVRFDGRDSLIGSLAEVLVTGYDGGVALGRHHAGE